MIVTQARSHTHTIPKFNRSREELSDVSLPLYKCWESTIQEAEERMTQSKKYKYAPLLKGLG